MVVKTKYNDDFPIAPTPITTTTSEDVHIRVFVLKR